MLVVFLLPIVLEETLVEFCRTIAPGLQIPAKPVSGKDVGFELGGKLEHIDAASSNLRVVEALKPARVQRHLLCKLVCNDMKFDVFDSQKPIAVLKMAHGSKGALVCLVANLGVVVTVEGTVAVTCDTLEITHRDNVANADKFFNIFFAMM